MADMEFYDGKRTVKLDNEDSFPYTITDSYKGGIGSFRYMFGYLRGVLAIIIVLLFILFVFYLALLIIPFQLILKPVYRQFQLLCLKVNNAVWLKEVFYRFCHVGPAIHILAF